jgi:hypothetical protein
MINELDMIFNDEITIEKIKKRLPYLFQLAEFECSRAGKIGMEIGSVREKIVVSLLIYRFGQKNVNQDIPITEYEIDVMLFNVPISIKTITGKNLGGVKLIWTVDAQKAIQFSNEYLPSCDIILVQINWDSYGGFYYIPLDVQKELFTKMGKQEYIKLPKIGTNPRGVEITKEALLNLVNDNRTRGITIEWKRADIDWSE